MNALSHCSKLARARQLLPSKEPLFRLQFFLLEPPDTKNTRTPQPTSTRAHSCRFAQDCILYPSTSYLLCDHLRAYSQLHHHAQTLWLQLQTSPQFSRRWVRIRWRKLSPMMSSNRYSSCSAFCNTNSDPSATAATSAPSAGPAARLSWRAAKSHTASGHARLQSSSTYEFWKC